MSSTSSFSDYGSSSFGSDGAADSRSSSVTSPLLRWQSPNRRTIESFDTESEVDGPIVVINERRGYSLRCCSRKTAFKVAFAVGNSAVFLTFGALFIKEFVGPGPASVVPLTLYSLPLGASISGFGHLIVPKKIKGWEARKLISEVVSHWSYEVDVYIPTQVLMSLDPPPPLIAQIPFVLVFGMLLGKDVIQMATRPMNVVPFTKFLKPQDVDRQLLMAGFDTRDNSLPAKIWIGAKVVSAVGLTIFNFAGSKYTHSGVLGQIAAWEALIALFSGSVLGEMLARLLDDWKERLEKARSDEGIPAPPLSRILAIMRIAKNYSIVLTPTMEGLLLALTEKLPPNTFISFLIMLIVGNLYGQRMLICEREFRNPDSFLHKRFIKEADIDGVQLTRKQKVWQVVKKYGLTTGFSVGLITWNSVVAASLKSARVSGAVVTLLTTYFASLIGTDILAAIYRPQRDARVANTLAFYFLFSAFALSLYYEVLRVKIPIVNGTPPNGNSSYPNATATYQLMTGLGDLEWAAWGVNLGSNRACNIQAELPNRFDMTPPLAIIELAKVIATLLGANTTTNSTR